VNSMTENEQKMNRKALKIGAHAELEWNKQICKNICISSPNMSAG